jgi:hypothetical protein
MSKKKVRSKKSFSLYQFHPSPAAGLKGGQFNRKRDFGLAKFIKKANIEYRIMNIEPSSGRQVSKECILTFL